MGKEHGGEESCDCYENSEEEGECTLALDCGEGHEAGVDGKEHGLVLVFLCIGFAVGDHKDYTYVFGGLGYEGVGGKKEEGEYYYTRIDKPTKYYHV